MRDLLTIVLIALPLIGALANWRLGMKRLETQRLLSIGLACLQALLALILFFVGGYLLCSPDPGEGNCLWSAIGVLSLFVAGLALAQYNRYDPSAPDAPEKALERNWLLALTGAWALLVLSYNFLMFLVGINLFFFVFMRWLKVRNLRPGLVIVRDDYKEQGQNKHRQG